ncbi:MAG: ABA4-like family protein [Erythrobacter sp.]
MSWDAVFGAANMLAMIAWAGLILLPRKPIVLALTLYIGVGILCATYAVSLIGIVSGTFDSGGSDVSMDFGSIESIRAIFASDGGIVVGWVHYLAFDLFVGLWIARDADAKNFSRWLQAPILLATLFAGPLGLFIWLLVREPAARRSGRPE